MGGEQFAQSASLPARVDRTARCWNLIMSAHDRRRESLLGCPLFCFILSSIRLLSVGRGDDVEGLGGDGGFWIC